MKICIDPGHPSEVGEGTRGKKLTEIRAAWLVAKRLEALLKAAGHEVKLTKASEKEFVKNRKRAEIANAFGADLLVRLHCDSEGGTGFWTYFPDRQGTDATGKRGPSTEVALQWATFYDAADQAGRSRLYGGIHVTDDDFAGRRLGSQIGIGAYERAQAPRIEQFQSAANASRRWSEQLLAALQVKEECQVQALVAARWPVNEAPPAPAPRRGTPHFQAAHA